MMKIEEPQVEALEELAPPIEPSASEQIALVIEDLRAMVKAEMRYHRSRLDYTRHVFRWSFRYGAVAAFAFSGASIALVLGLVLTLSPLIGPLAATLLVTISFVTIGIVFAAFARRWMRKVYFPEMPKNVDDIT
ncbi:phage holin family protein [Sphingorhabdus sp. EL138]|uniref:phage holin family protein n=1 Tax=Sphingorhabdus sp. EL138 TaxID=2073156 RepID=UPI002600899F|nr:phage holin family protein [Sphingorhabdus sp. EL138]